MLALAVSILVQHVQQDLAFAGGVGFRDHAFFFPALDDPSSLFELRRTRRGGAVVSDGERRG
jgi:hypothetical protein